MRYVFCLLLGFTLSANAGFQCDSPPEARRFLRLFMASNSQWHDPAERQREVADWVARHPKVFALRDLQQRVTPWEDQAAFRARLMEELKTADDPVLALTTAAMAWHRTDTPQAIALLQRAQELQPGDPVSALQLARIHIDGKFQDRDKSRHFFEVYATGCPGSLDADVDFTMWQAAAPLETQARMAAALRQRLQQVSEPEDADLFSVLWSIEFRTRPAAEHGAVRQQVREDIAALEKRFTNPDARLLSVFRDGSKQAGAPPDELAAYGARIQQADPNSWEAFWVANELWTQAHREPENHSNAEAWAAWKRARFEILSRWKEQFPQVTWLIEERVELGIDIGALTKEEAIHAIAEPLALGMERKQILLSPAMTASTFLLDRQWEHGRTIPWLRKAWEDAVRLDVLEYANDTLTEKDRTRRQERGGYQSWVAQEWLRAARAIGLQELPSGLRELVERPVPETQEYLTDYFVALGRLAAFDGRAADALTYYQQALANRQSTPGFTRGIHKDLLLEEAKAYFLEANGTEQGFAVWSGSRTKPGEALASERWETPKKKLPSFALQDLNGKTWSLSQQEGKVVLINLWATWCGPCVAELPLFQKLYDATKHRTDIQLLTFNIDAQPGLVEPYMKERGFSFPVLIAEPFVRELLDSVTIPQNWLVNRQGEWVATQVGFDANEPDWIGRMRSKLDSLKATNP